MELRNTEHRPNTGGTREHGTTGHGTPAEHWRDTGTLRNNRNTTRNCGTWEEQQNNRTTKQHQEILPIHKYGMPSLPYVDNTLWRFGICPRFTITLGGFGITFCDFRIWRSRFSVPGLTLLDFVFQHSVFRRSVYCPFLGFTTCRKNQGPRNVCIQDGRWTNEEPAQFSWTDYTLPKVSRGKGRF